MTLTLILAGTFVAGTAVLTYLMRAWKIGPFLDMPSLDREPEDLPYIPASVPPIQAPPKPPQAPTSPVPAPEVADSTPNGTEANKALFDTPQNAFHSVRVLCDDEGLSVSEKNLICSVIYQESEFKNRAIYRNKDKNGKTTSTDWGICQINDYWHCGKGKTFPSAEYVVAHPEEAVKFMLKMYRLGLLKLWVGYSSGAYQKWLSPSSPMWGLKT